jgi:hypothetical protein
VQGIVIGHTTVLFSEASTNCLVLDVSPISEKVHNEGGEGGRGGGGCQQDFAWSELEGAANVANVAEVNNYEVDDVNCGGHLVISQYRSEAVKDHHHPHHQQQQQTTRLTVPPSASKQVMDVQLFLDLTKWLSYSLSSSSHL